MDGRSSFPAGRQIAFTGRLASMSRASAVRVVTEQGGVVRSRVTRATDAVVIGADGWPLRKSGSITRNLQRASQLQEAGFDVSIIGEAEFVRLLCDGDESQPIRSRYTLEHLSRLLDISGLRLRRWIELGLIQATDRAAVPPKFDFQEVTAARTLSRLISRGVPASQLAQSLRLLQRWFPGDRCIGTGIIALEKQLLVRHGTELIDQRGQLYFTFDDPPAVLSECGTDDFNLNDDADDLFDRAYRDELEGHCERAIEGYTNWLNRFGEDHEVLFNLANVYFQQGMLEQALAHYRRCVKHSSDCARGWNNLGLCLYQAGELWAAIDAVRQSVMLECDNVDTLFNLADMLDEAGGETEASLLWLQLARHRSDTAVRQYARTRRGNLVPSH